MKEGLVTVADFRKMKSRLEDDLLEKARSIVKRGRIGVVGGIESHLEYDPEKTVGAISIRTGMIVRDGFEMNEHEEKLCSEFSDYLNMRLIRFETDARQCVHAVDFSHFEIENETEIAVLLHSKEGCDEELMTLQGSVSFKHAQEDKWSLN